jgi:hypothetical protein
MGAVMARRHPRCGAAARGAAARWKSVATRPGSGGTEGEDEADSRGPLERETRGRRSARKARTKRENILPQIRHRCMG